ncbi:type II toxin-antitoxin system VapC family toxin [Aeromonas caviae]|jgi:predicted nucleic acid-binding protein|nr:MULTISPECIES: type II toxin-antitoxin system VapC family toxin [Aeromonas]MBL0529654.1 type II toxin-antitoxin system VapC family toxin [Aeromonas caviae]MBL0539422.1 type II toxin-antitoxin system VapC family toxin [Aeromonas caviae]MBL0584209.1 type II toxin-antitoxin system VapC family toxin [Aeromonas caviae]MDH1634374.1 type II toxin-antitoxin system VapC family toxin [Aeromonas caviae]MDX7738700.1 type II toxin-antitoxin system VapC family toxin [Aeromonas caviae]
MSVQKKLSTPQAGDSFFIDTNVWLWTTYFSSRDFSSANKPFVNYQIEKYPSYIEKILDAGASMYHSALTLTEIAHVIERIEFDIYREDQANRHIKLKDFRKINTCREKVISEIKAAWQAITSMSRCLDFVGDSELSQKCIEILSTSQLDSYDSIMTHVALKNNIRKFLTDDKDFETIHGLEVYTYRN